MNKVELVAEIAEKTNMTKKNAEACVKAFVETVSEALAKGDSVQLVGFGTFDIGTRGARKGRNPKTGATIDIPASKSPKFKPGKSLKDKVNGK